LEEEMEQITVFAEDAAEDAGDGENELPVGDLMADGGGDPDGGLADATLVTGGAEVAAFAREGKETFPSVTGMSGHDASLDGFPHISVAGHLFLVA
jgi:hypothetical protein